MPRGHVIISPNLLDLKSECSEHLIKVIESQKLYRFHMMLTFILPLKLDGFVDPSFMNSAMNGEFDPFPDDQFLFDQIGPNRRGIEIVNEQCSSGF